ncbi:MAG TPA: sigma-70 family RNA polymerase sigma factor [Peptococcaceae bacterium]|nr:sigma-70 family RNA polymerase sigma factor [Peptococcaceae bacterium]
MSSACKQSCGLVNFCRYQYQFIDSGQVFQALYEKYKYLIYNFFYKKTNYNNATAEDLTQETFIKVYRSLPKIDSYCNIVGWLYVIATNTLRDYQRKNHRKPQYNNELDLDSINLKPEKDECPSNLLFQNDLKYQLSEIIKSLPPKYCTAIYLHDYENRTYAEAASKMNISVAAYTSLLNRARLKLKEAVIANLFKVDINTLSKNESNTLSKWLALTNIFEDISEPIEKGMQAYFNQDAASYNDHDYYDYHSVIDNCILEKYPLQKKHIVADFGMGTGIFTAKLSRYVQRVDGYDYSQEMCELARVKNNF